ncbi:MAG: stearoyl-CoA desaturase (delta-9 desaturase) [Moritella dasanensis]|jgi:stearoyl-CoA desaturase (delta-9 desaturase)
MKDHIMKKPPLIWLNVFVFASTFLAAITLVPWYGFTYGFETFEVVAMIVGIFVCGLSITGGYHRLWSHRTYKAHWSVRLIFALGGAFALQNSAIHWSSDHRRHHKHVDHDDKDPYSASHGFWFSHIGWMLREYNAMIYTDYTNVRDLQKDGIAVWQHKYYNVLALVMNVGVPILVGLLYGDVWASLLLLGVARLVLSHHFTFFINSWAHMWGTQPYTDRNTARDNALLAIFTHGEGYHNYHHIFETDYRNGIKWYQYDPTKWLINVLAWCNLASDLRTVPEARIEQAKLKMELKRRHDKVQHLPNADEVILRLNQEYDVLCEKLNAFYKAKVVLFESKKKSLNEKLDKIQFEQQIRDTKLQLSQLKEAFYDQRKVWNNMQLSFAH